MLNKAQLVVTIPVVDLDRATAFYTDKLGLKLDTSQHMPGMNLLMTEQKTQVCLYQRGPSKADHTLASFTVDDIEATIKNLEGKGIVFEDYDFPTLKTDASHIALQGTTKGAWFKDSEGNILGLVQM